MEQQSKNLEKSDKPIQRSEFSRLMDTFRDAVEDFRSEASADNFAKVLNSISDFGTRGARYWDDARSFAKKHPVPVALGAGLVFFAMRGLIAPHRSQRGSTLH